MLFVNEKTLFTFLIPGIKRSYLKDIKDLFINNLRLNLAFLGIDLSSIQEICEPYKEYTISKTSSKSVLGSMNDYARCFKAKIYYDNEQMIDNILQTNFEMNKMPMGAIGYSSGEEKLFELLTKAGHIIRKSTRSKTCLSFLKID